MITYQIEDLNDMLEELKPLLEEHYLEIAMYKDQIKLNPDYDTYAKLQEQGVLKIFTARDSDKLVGYSIYFLKTNLHYSDHLYAINDIVYVDKEYRGRVLAFDMLAFAEDQLADQGVSVITMHMKTFAAFETLMECLSYDRAEIIYTKYLGDK